MSQCVPSWDLPNKSSPPMVPNSSDLSPSEPFDVPVWDNHVTELAWENGQLSMHGFVKANPSRSLVSSPPLNNATYTPRPTVNLEPIVEQVQEDLAADDLVPWFDGFSQPQSVPMDALVPCYLPPIGSERFNKKSVRCDTQSACGSVTFDETADKTVVQTDAAFHVSHAHDFSDYLDLDSIYPPSSSIAADDQKKANCARASSSTKRSRLAAVHNLSERKRRDKINQRIKTLQSFVPNSTKTDKISVLDEVIEYVKQLQSEAQAKDKPPPVTAPAVQSQQQLPVLLMNSMGVGVGMGVGLSFVGMNPIQRPVVPPLPAPAPAPFLHPSVMMPLQAWEGSTGGTLYPSPPVACLQDPMSAYLKPQPMSMDAYSRMVAFYRQLHHQPSSTSKN